MKKILTIIICFLSLFFISSCYGHGATGVSKGRMYFATGSAYENKDEIPDVFLNYTCYKKYYSDDVNLNLYFGQKGKVSKDYEDEKYELTVDSSKYEFKLYLVDDAMNKIQMLDNLKKVRPEFKCKGSSFHYSKEENKYLLYLYFENNIAIKLDNELFDADNGSIYLAVFQTELEGAGEELLSTYTSVDYFKKKNRIYLIPPKNSYLGTLYK